MSTSNNAKTLRSYPKYVVHANGTVTSKRTGEEIKPVADTSAATVRLINRNGERKRVSVASLVKKAFPL
jgi:U3 small nucleolar ribonucleoprotein component